MTSKTEEQHQSKGFTGRGEGVTDAERYLKRLCDRSFLSLWSYAGIYRDQWLRGGVKEGKEVCDLLVVFENHIIIFSDKDCVYKMGDDPAINWQRWFKKAVQKSSDQIWGAERWLKTNPSRLFGGPWDFGTVQEGSLGKRKSYNCSAVDWPDAYRWQPRLYYRATRSCQGLCPCF